MTHSRYSGNLRKMKVQHHEPVHYSLPVGDELLELNPLVGGNITLRYDDVIHCIACGRLTKKSFNQGYCFPCMRSLAECDMCIVRPEMCHLDQGTCRDENWAESHCLQPHIVYLANSSGLKVGITRQSQIPTRWIDQGATQALPLFQVKDRYTSGLLEVIFKQHVADRTDWRKMLKGVADEMDLVASAQQLIDASQSEIARLIEGQGKHAISQLNEAAVDIHYPVEHYPEKIKSHNLDKAKLVEGKLLGIKGQYLILDSGVINIRKYSGYSVCFEFSA